ncbi:MAG TPA: TetR/AcrR family transcriptional regulator [Bryocella sp.]|nr:TetR/AcrR family transcriptional regulator [Bryocella sp.]
MQHHQSKAKLLAATIKVVRTKGYNATRVEDVCAEAGVTKGSFFHHFKSKDDLALAALDHWKASTTDLFANAPYHGPSDPLDRVLAYIDFRKALLAGELRDFTCFPGTVVQEMYATSPPIRAACESSICGHAKTLEADIDAAIAEYGVAEDITASSLALHMQCVLQGAFILVKATGSATVAVDSIEHLRRYILLLFRASKDRRVVRARRKPDADASAGRA